MSVNVIETGHNEGYSIAEWASLGQDETGNSVAFSEYPDKTVQAVGANWGSGGTVTMQGSMDNENFVTLTDFDGNDVVFSADGMVVIRENPRFIRPLASDTASLDVAILLGCTRAR